MNEERFNNWTDVDNMKDHIRILEQRVDFMREKLEMLDKQEPVGEVLDERGEVDWISFVPPAGTSLYTTPPQRKPLTEDEIDAFMPAADGSAETDVVSVEVSPGIWGKEYSEVDAWSRPLVFQIARAIEAAHGIKGDA